MSAPPRVAERLVAALTPRADRDAVLGDMEEGYRAVLDARDPAAAGAWYFSQVTRSIPGLLSLHLQRARSSKGRGIERAVPPADGQAEILTPTPERSVAWWFVAAILLSALVSLATTLVVDNPNMHGRFLSPVASIGIYMAVALLVLVPLIVLTRTRLGAPGWWWIGFASFAAAQNLSTALGTWLSGAIIPYSPKEPLGMVLPASAWAIVFALLFAIPPLLGCALARRNDEGGLLSRVLPAKDTALALRMAVLLITAYVLAEAAYPAVLPVGLTDLYVPLSFTPAIVFALGVSVFGLPRSTWIPLGIAELARATSYVTTRFEGTASLAGSLASVLATAIMVVAGALLGIVLAEAALRVRTARKTT